MKRRVTRKSAKGPTSGRPDRAHTEVAPQSNPVRRHYIVPSVAEPDQQIELKKPTVDMAMVQRIENLPHDIGWMLIWVGALGVVLPGVVGLPLLIAGAAVVTPGGRKLLSRWIARRPPAVVNSSMQVIDRMLTEMDQRYPRLPKAGASASAAPGP
jgi:hypothetical protein